ncbi:MAG: hypothetical protein JXX14_21770 [Deltaproteobacteria bacterium]|nr:hypothetical protein [Deltaproteobacteria bacterium]
MNGANRCHKHLALVCILGQWQAFLSWGRDTGVCEQNRGTLFCISRNDDDSSDDDSGDDDSSDG